jgi:hypothetical protein
MGRDSELIEIEADAGGGVVSQKGVDASGRSMPVERSGLSESDVRVGATRR